ncbi:HEPN domain-containing protein [Sutcliffiella horikoshii]|uniref:HEPN domain-containing protein n=1 Tax=Sutcliffiella horikoshii TaxID=79883 RepID=UPI00385024CF
MNRSDFQDIANLRLKEAKVLLENECYYGAYYITGYVVECALKACIAKRTKQYEFPDKRIVNRIYTQNLLELINVLGVFVPSELETNWAVVKDWSEHDRYRKHSLEEAYNIYEAVTDSENGVLQWLKGLW